LTTREASTAIILCGGRGTRLGGIEKPLVELHGKPLVGHVIDRLAGQVDAIVLACRRSAEVRGYVRLGYPIAYDEHEDQGPLGGIISALGEVATPWLLTTAADTPFLPLDLVRNLAPACRQHGAAVASAAGRRQNLTVLMQRSKAKSLAAFYAAGGRATHRWLAAQGVPEVEFHEAAFLNVNSAADLERARMAMRE
jgi:molybdopterin-guanine dinucleotide biosynthesis protein A